MKYIGHKYMKRMNHAASTYFSLIVENLTNFLDKKYLKVTKFLLHFDYSQKELKYIS